MCNRPAARLIDGVRYFFREVRHARLDDDPVRPPRLQLHGRKRRNVRKVLQRALQAGRQQNRAALRVPAPGLSLDTLQLSTLKSQLSRVSSETSDLRVERF